MRTATKGIDKRAADRDKCGSSSFAMISYAAIPTILMLVVVVTPVPVGIAP